MSARLRSILFHVSVFLLSLQRQGNGDALWHLRLGELALDQNTIPTVDAFSHTFFGRPMTPHSVLYEILSALFFRIAGWPGITLFIAATKTLLFFLLVRAAVRLGASNKLAPIGSFALIWMAAPQLYPPQLFSYVLLVALLGWFPKPESSPTAAPNIIGAALLVLAWPLLHPSFPIGIGILCLYAIYERRRAAAWFGAAALAAGAIYIIHPPWFKDVFLHAESEVLREYVGQWKPLFTVSGSDFYSTSILLSLLFVLMAWTVAWVGRKDLMKATWPLSLLAIGGFAMMLTSVRFLPMFVLVAGLSSLIVLKEKLLAAVGFVAVFSVLTYLRGPTFNPGLTLDTERLPVDCVSFLKAAHLKGEMFNSYTFGSYLIYELQGKPRVFVDPRATQLYTEAFLKEFLNAYADPAAFEELGRKYGVGYTVLKSDSKISKRLIEYLNSSSGWKKVYADPLCVIHERRAP